MRKWMTEKKIKPWDIWQVIMKICPVMTTTLQLSTKISWNCQNVQHGQAKIRIIGTKNESVDSLLI